MATDVTQRDVSIYAGPTGRKVTTSFGQGVPARDVNLDDDVKNPIGSQYTDLATGKIWTKTAAATWTDSSAA